MRDDFDLEEELAKSIASIVDEETADAHAYVNKNTSETDDIPDEEEKIYDEPDDDSDDDSDKPDKKKIIIIVASVVAAVLIIGITAFLVVRAAFNKSKDNYGYYNELGYKAYDDKDYDTAISDFEKALTYDEGKGDSDTNINMMLYLFECYKNTSQDDKAEEILLDVLDRDSDNKNAYYNLMSVYLNGKDYTKLGDLYEKAAATEDDDIIALFKKYVPQDPVATPDEGSYSDDQKVFLSADDGCKIYYTIDGSDPKDNAQVFSNRIELKEGQTTVKFYAVNDYGIKSDVITKTYNIQYSGPATPEITPSDTTISQSSKVMVTVTGIASGSKAYYTLDGTAPTTDSTEYSKPFELPAGTTVVTVMVVDGHGKSTMASKTYKVTYESKYTQTEAEDFIWSALIDKKIVNKKHIDKDDNECSMDYYSLKTVDDKQIYMFYYNIGHDAQDYWYGADANTGDVYKVTCSKGSYKLSSVK